MHSILTHKKKRPDDDDDVIPEAIREREESQTEGYGGRNNYYTCVCVRGIFWSHPSSAFCPQERNEGRMEGRVYSYKRGCYHFCHVRVSCHPTIKWLRAHFHTKGFGSDDDQATFWRLKRNSSD